MWWRRVSIASKQVRNSLVRGGTLTTLTICESHQAQIEEESPGYFFSRLACICRRIERQEGNVLRAAPLRIATHSRRPYNSDILSKRESHFALQYLQRLEDLLVLIPVLQLVKSQLEGEIPYLRPISWRLIGASLYPSAPYFSQRSQLNLSFSFLGM